MLNLLRFDNRVWLLWAVWILLLPLKWIFAAAAAACIHEVCHIAAVLLLGGRVRGITVAPLGAVIEVEGVHGYREILCTLAGPVGSFLLMSLIHRFPLLGLCGLVQGVFNLLPVYPLDGGRALAGFLEATVPNQAGMISLWIERIVFFLLMALVIFVSLRYSLGFFPVMFCVLMIINARLRKRP